jgi:hypothetical protein
MPLKFINNAVNILTIVLGYFWNSKNKNGKKKSKNSELLFLMGFEPSQIAIVDHSFQKFPKSINNIWLNLYLEIQIICLSFYQFLWISFQLNFDFIGHIFVS